MLDFISDSIEHNMRFRTEVSTHGTTIKEIQVDKNIALQGKILIMDDDRAILKLLGGFFAGLEYDVHLAIDGEEGLFLFHNCQPDIVLVDLNMPKVDGFKVLDVISKEFRDFSCTL